MSCLVEIGDIYKIDMALERRKLTLAVSLLLCVFSVADGQAENSTFCSSQADCNPENIDLPNDNTLIRCANDGQRCLCTDCFRISTDGRCRLGLGCWKINTVGNGCILLDTQKDYFPLVISLYLTSGLALVLILLSIILMSCTIRNPHQRQFVSTRKRMDFVFASLIGLVVFSTAIFFGSISGGMALISSIDFEVLGDFFERCIWCWYRNCWVNSLCIPFVLMYSCPVMLNMYLCCVRMYV